jgi:hypothetical protein
MKPYFTLKANTVLTILGLSCSTQSVTAQANLVVNGGFDTDASGWAITNVYASYGGGFTSSVGNPAGSVFLYNPNFGPSHPPPTASQEISSLTPGDLYLVSGDYRGGGKNVLDNSFGVAVNGAYFFETEAPANSAWYHFSFDYAATSTSALLSISSQMNGTDDSYFIDNISMQVIPEQSSLRLIGMGGLVSAMLFGTRRKS